MNITIKESSDSHMDMSLEESNDSPMKMSAGESSDESSSASTASSSPPSSVSDESELNFADRTFFMSENFFARQPLDRLRKFKKVKTYLQTCNAYYAVCELTESDYSALCKDSDRIILNETLSLPKNDNKVKIYLRSENSTSNGNKDDSKEDADHRHFCIAKRKNHRPASTPYDHVTTPRPNMRFKRFDYFASNDV